MAFDNSDRLVFDFEIGKISIRDPNFENGLRGIVVLSCTDANAKTITDYIMSADREYGFKAKEFYRILDFSRQFYSKVVTLISLKLPDRTPPEERIGYNLKVSKK